MVNPKKKGFILVLTLSLFLFPLVSTASFPIYVTPLDGSGNLQPTTSFAYEWKFTSASDCSGVLFTKTATIITDKYGRGFVNLTLEPFSTIPSYVCEYRNGTLRASLPLSTSLFSNTYVQNLNASGNVTAQYFFGDGSQLTGLAMAGETDPHWAANLSVYNASWSSTYNLTYAAYNSTGLIKDWNASGLIKNWSAGFLASETDPLWTANHSTYLTLFNWNKTYADTLYYGKNNPYGYINATTLSGSESDPLWAANQSLYPRITELAGLVGNWSLDKLNYYNSTQVTSAIGSANTSLKDYVDGNFYLKSNPYNYINSTSLSASETDPLWTANQSSYLRIIDLIGLVGNFSAYVQPTALSNFTDNILWTAAFNATGDSRWLSAFSETDPQWSGNASSVYLKSNPYGFYNSTSLTSLSQLADNLGNRGYTSLSNFTDNLGNRGYTALSNFSNDMGFVNSSALSGLESDPHWASNQSSYPRIIELVGLIGNWSADKSNYYTSGQTDSAISNANTSMKNYVDGNYYPLNNPYSYLNATSLAESDPLWTANQSSYSTTSQANALYYGITNPSGFYNSSNFNINDYYLKSNPYSYINSTSLAAAETDPLWTSNQSNYYNRSQIEGNLTNYYNSTQTNSAIVSANTSLKNYADAKFIASADEANLNVNSSGYWDSLDSPSDILGSSINNDLNWINATTLSAAENDPMWTSNFTAHNASWSSTYNSTYATWAYNQTTAATNLLNGTGLIKDWNSTGYIRNWNTEIGVANTSMKNYADGSFLRRDGDNGTGQYNFGGAWTEGGATIKDGNLYAQTIYVYNVTSLGVNNLNINGSLLPPDGYDATFDVGVGNLRWRDGFFSRNLFVNGTIYGNWNGSSDYYTKSQVDSNFTNYYTKSDVTTNISNANTSLKNYADNLFYLKSNPYNYINATTLSLAETDPQWNSNASLVYLKSNPYGFYNSTSLTSLSQLSNDLGIGNWSADKSNYYNSSQVDSSISSANTSIKNYADGMFYLKSNPNNYLNSTTVSGVYVPYTGSNANIVLNDYNFSIGTSAFFIDANRARVGIGTTSLFGTLNLHGGTGEGSSYDTMLYLSRTSSSANVEAAKIVLDDKDTNWANLVFRVKTTASSAENSAYYTDAMTIDGQNGNVGVNNSAPTSKLTVSGTFNSTNNGGTISLDASGNVKIGI